MTVLKISGILNRQRNGILISGLFIILVGWFDSGVAENCSGRTYEKLEAARVDFRAVKNQLEPGAPPMRVVSPDGTKVAALEKVKILMESQVFLDVSPHGLTPQNLGRRRLDHTRRLGRHD